MDAIATNRFSDAKRLVMESCPLNLLYRIYLSEGDGSTIPFSVI